MSFLHQSAPRAVQEGGRSGIAVIESSASRAAAGGGAKKKYRDPLLEEAQSATTLVQPNIMYDPRVQRGSTAGKTAILTQAAADAQFASTLPRYEDGAPVSGPSASSLAAAGARAKKASLLASGAIRPKQHSAAYIHSHISVTKQRVEVPLHLYLVEQKEATLVHHVPQQTDEWMEEAPAPQYIPRKIGRDTSTQVDNSLVFDFDSDVAAILEVLVSKSTEQSLMEVREEEGMRSIHEHKQALYAKFEAEETQAEERLRAERALFAAKENMMSEARARHQHVLAIRSKLAASYFSHHFLKNLRSHALDSLHRDGFFSSRDSVAHQLESSYLPRVFQSTELHLSQQTGAKKLVEEILGERLKQMQEEKKEIDAAREAAEAAAAEEMLRNRLAAEDLSRRQRKIQLFIHSDSLPAEANPVGPINLTGQSTVSDVESKVARWMDSHLSDVDLGVGIELPLQRERVKFQWNGRTLSQEDANTSVYDLGIADLATLSMHIEPPPPPPPVKEKRRKKKQKRTQKLNEDGTAVITEEDDEEEGNGTEAGEDDEEEEDGEDEEEDEEEGEEEDEAEQGADAEDAAKSGDDDTQEDADDV